MRTSQPQHLLDGVSVSRSVLTVLEDVVWVVRMLCRDIGIEGMVRAVTWISESEERATPVPALGWGLFLS